MKEKCKYPETESGYYGLSRTKMECGPDGGIPEYLIIVKNKNLYYGIYKKGRMINVAKSNISHWKQYRRQD